MVFHKKIKILHRTWIAALFIRVSHVCCVISRVFMIWCLLCQWNEYTPAGWEYLFPLLDEALCPSSSQFYSLPLNLIVCIFVCACLSISFLLSLSISISLSLSLFLSLSLSPFLSAQSLALQVSVSCWCLTAGDSRKTKHQRLAFIVRP